MRNSDACCIDKSTHIIPFVNLEIRQFENHTLMSRAKIRRGTTRCLEIKIERESQGIYLSVGALTCIVLMFVAAVDFGMFPYRKRGTYT